MDNYEEMDELVLTDESDEDPSITGFNGEGEIRIAQLDESVLPPLKNAEFKYFEFLDLETIDTDDPEFLNVGIRDDNKPNANMTPEERVQSFRTSFRRKGFLVKEPTPAMDLDGIILNGRHRFKAAKANGEKWMPIARYSRTDKSLKNTVGNGIRANNGIPRYNSQFADFVAGALCCIMAGELKEDAGDILNFLIKDCGLLEVYDTNDNGMHTKMVNTILKRAKEGDGLIIARTDSACHKWIKDNKGLVKSDYVLLNAKSGRSGETYVARAWKRISAALIAGEDPVSVIFYSTEALPSDARDALTDSITMLEEQYLNCWEVVNTQFECMELNAPSSRPYKILGAIPQIVGDHALDAPYFVKIDKY